MSRYGLLAAVCLTFLSPDRRARATDLSDLQRETLGAYARDTWRSLQAMTPDGGLPADHLTRTESGWQPAGYTSPTNIAASLWSTIAAEKLGLVSSEKSSATLQAMLRRIHALERFEGFFYNWYSPTTGEKIMVWPGGGPIIPFLSSVDNGWLASALHLTARAHPELSIDVESILGSMNFLFFYDTYDPQDPLNHPGLLRGGYYPIQKVYTGYHYGLLNTEPRIASYLGIARGHLPSEHYFHLKRGTPVTSLPEHTQGKVLPSWDGTLFEALMVALFVPESPWGPENWGKNHPRYVRAQIEYGLTEARLGYWGISASSDPEGGYAPFGVGRLARSPNPRHGRGVVTPHASFLALAFAPQEAMLNLEKLAKSFPIYSDFGFLDSVDVRNGRVSNQVLVLDQGMILASIVNALNDGFLQKTFSDGAIENAIRPLIASDRFALDDETSLSPVDSAKPLVAIERTLTSWKSQAGYALLTPPMKRKELRRSPRRYAVR